MCMEKPLYDLVIGNIKEAREPDIPDETWKERIDSEEDKKCASIETRAQKRAKQNH